MPRRMFDDVPGMVWCGQYILGGEDEHTPIPCYSLSKWGRWLAYADRGVAWTGNRSKYVSTVFLAFDCRHHFGGGPPLVFETMLFLDGHGDSMECYSSWDDAETGHKCFVRKYLVNRKTRVKTETKDASYMGKSG